MPPPYERPAGSLASLLLAAVFLLRCCDVRELDRDFLFHDPFAEPVVLFDRESADRFAVQELSEWVHQKDGAPTKLRLVLEDEPGPHQRHLCHSLPPFLPLWL